MNDLERSLDELLSEYEIDQILETLAAVCRWHVVKKQRGVKS